MKMTDELINRLKSHKTTLENFYNYSIAPIHSEMMDMRRLYETIGHPPIGTCGSCNAQICNTLYDHLKEENLI